MALGKIEIKMIDTNEYQITLGRPEGDKILHYKLLFDAAGFSNINMDKWPPEIKDGNYCIKGTIENPSWYSFKVEGLRKIVIKARFPHKFDLYYTDATIKPPDITLLRKNRVEITWSPPELTQSKEQISQVSTNKGGIIQFVFTCLPYISGIIGFFFLFKFLKNTDFFTRLKPWVLWLAQR